MRNRIKGFTLIELLVVIGIVGILLTITLVAINPARQFALANDTGRKQGINSISSAVAQIIIDNTGVMPAAADPGSVYKAFSSADASLQSLCQGITGLASVTKAGSQTYMSKLPIDPRTGTFTSCTDFDTGYSIRVQSNRVYVKAQMQETTAPEEVSR